MCGVTVGIWLVCALIIFAAFSIPQSATAGLVLVLMAMVLAVALPPIVTFFMPLFAGWNAANRKLRDRLIADGVMAAEEVESGIRAVDVRQVLPATERTIPGTRERGFIQFRDGEARFLGENRCWTAKRFKVMPGRSTRCSRCAILWVCGLAPFRIILEDQERPCEYLVSCREGRKLSTAQHNTDMLAELGMMEDSYEASEHIESHDACFDLGADEPPATPADDPK